MFVRILTTCLSLLLLSNGRAFAQPSHSTSSCDPNLALVFAPGGINFNCNNQVYTEASQKIMVAIQAENVSLDQEKAIVNGLNAFIRNDPQIQTPAGDRLNDAEYLSISKQLSGLTSLVQTLVSNDDTPAQIEEKFAANSHFYPPGYQLSACRCWGNTFATDQEYGEEHDDLDCFGGKEENMACEMNTGANVCTGSFFSDTDPYAPWQRVCAPPPPPSSDGE